MKTDMEKFKELFLECNKAIDEVCKTTQCQIGIINTQTHNILTIFLMYLELQGEDDG